MKNKLKVALLTVLTAISVFAVCLFAGCNVDYEAIYNDDAQIISRNVHSSMASVEQSKTDSFSYSCSKFSGVQKIKSYTVNGDSQMNVSLTVEAGDFKLVLTNSSTVYVLAEGSYDGAVNFEDIPEGKYDLKMVGVAAELQLQINY